MTRPKIGLALGGGAARGWAHIGVLAALEEAGLAPDVVAGTSMGAVAGGCYVAGKLDELQHFALGLTRRSVFGFLDFNFGGSGLISGRRLCDQLDGHLEPMRIEDLDRKFVAVATELSTGHEIWLSKGRLVDAMHASYALPGIFKPVKINGRWLMDGALVNPIPVSVCRALGARIVIAVNLHADVFGKGAVIHDHASIDEAMIAEEATPPGENGRAARRLLHRQFFGRGENGPGISTVMMDALNIVQDRIARSRLAGDPPDLMISPRLGDVGLFDFHRAADAIPAGREAAEKVVEEARHTIGMLAA
jgi:NTE family protein